MVTYEEMFEYTLKHIVRASNAEAEIVKLKARINDLQIELDATAQALEHFQAIKKI
jgi:hypothetical protein